MIEKMKVEKIAMRNYKDGSMCRVQTARRSITWNRVYTQGSINPEAILSELSSWICKNKHLKKRQEELNYVYHGLQ